MTQIITAITTGVAAFIATNLDDILILTLLFTRVNPLFRRRHIVIGQYLGFSLLLVASLTGFCGSFLIPVEWIRYLGLIPVILGIMALVKGEDGEEENVEIDAGAVNRFPLGRWLSPQTFGVAALTVANGSDNIGVYTPLFASSSLPNLMAIVSVFLSLVGVWCFTAYKLTSLPAGARGWRSQIATLLNDQGATFVPCVLIGLGVFIIKENIPLAFLALGTSYLWALSNRENGSESV
ncbi:cadmium resistance transporter [Pannus brasiliensis CCIBt3594]|uniref:Cadmium resistance transporter n=1 Tax=Pannus brasiliensis CCIBt3594 TaxID=1427578 RepID=A0AAW9QI63_9CHRO